MAIVAARLAELETVIERGQQTFVEVGVALLEIRDGRLYRESHATFEDYCRERWGWGKSNANKLVSAAEVVQSLGNGLPIPGEARQAIELAPLREQPEAMREVWAGVIAKAEETDQPVTGPVIRSAVRDFIRGQAAEAEAELQSATSWMSAAQREGYRPEMVRQRGELARLVRDLADLPDPVLFVAAHNGLLSPQVAEQAQRAHEWLGRFLEAWRTTRGD